MGKPFRRILANKYPSFYEQKNWGGSKMTREELINRVVQAYFNNEDWRGLLKQLVKEVKLAQKEENNKGGCLDD
ncbi:hypothetical protein KVG29_05010 [Caldicoprobacter algeriensis]|uniref:hypothetical protein n=1 Tax=Caldicoprobacter algeriensis TaxID=699281 RepID=UPI00207A7EB0|nr:hypothetical protein [Caldicoprobacter algeriensis]MCM8900587.1 hypothetical protein [Caldicoprobacter algeriensis]